MRRYPILRSSMRCIVYILILFFSSVPVLGHFGSMRDGGSLSTPIRRYFFLAGLEELRHSENTCAWCLWRNGVTEFCFLGDTWLGCSSGSGMDVHQWWDLPY